MLLKLATFMPHFGLNFIGTKVRLTLDRVRFVRNNSRTNGNEVNERDISEYFFVYFSAGGSVSAAAARGHRAGP